MSAYPVRSVESAPEGSKAALEILRAAFGFIPNIAGAMANSPVLVSSLPSLFTAVHTGSFTEAQIQAILLTNAVTNRCPYAVALHTFLALKENVDASEVDAIRAARLPQQPKLAALSLLARTLIEKRGHLTEQDQSRFLAAGFGREHLLEVITVVAASTITNFTGNVTTPPLEPQFQPHVWTA